MIVDPTLSAWAEAVLLPCFDGTVAPDWVRRRLARGLGGVCLFARNVGPGDALPRLAGSLHAERDGVVIAIDEEAGDVTRIDAATGSRFPGAAALGRVDDVALTGTIALQVGKTLAAAGITVNFAPCADVAVDPANPVIGSRSFGADVDLVARHTAAWVRGQQAAGVAACAKHFPGHGDTDADTHLALAVLDASLDTVMSQAIPPFRAAVEADCAAVMAGHLLIPSVDTDPASLSRRWQSDVLRGELGFDGTIVSDALEMAAVRDLYGIPEAAVRALVAGTDLLCIGGEPMPEHELDAISDAIVAAVRNGTLSDQRLSDAAARAARLAGSWQAGFVPNSVVPVSTGAGTAWDPAVSALVADRALEVAGPLPELHSPILVVRCEDRPNIAVGAIPWGPVPALPASARVTERVVHRGDPVPADTVRDAQTVLVVTRDRHRHPWMGEVLTAVRAERGDAVLVEMGISGISPDDAPAVASFGGTSANAAAVVRLLSDSASPP